MNNNLAAPCGIYCGACRAYLLREKDLFEERGYKSGFIGCRIMNKKCAFIRRDCIELRKNAIDFWKAQIPKIDEYIQEWAILETKAWNLINKSI